LTLNLFALPDLLDDEVGEHTFTVQRRFWERLRHDGSFYTPAKVMRRLAADKYDPIDFQPPKSVADEAEKGLEYRAKANPSDKGGLTPAEASEQGIGSGVQRATNLKNQTNVSPEVIRQMCAFFARHEKNKGIAPENRDTPWGQRACRVASLGRRLGQGLG
jgi:hypothetical protein